MDMRKFDSLKKEHWLIVRYLSYDGVHKSIVDIHRLGVYFATLDEVFNKLYHNAYRKMEARASKVFHKHLCEFGMNMNLHPEFTIYSDSIKVRFEGWACDDGNVEEDFYLNVFYEVVNVEEHYS